jgi:hypothetical protein
MQMLRQQSFLEAVIPWIQQVKLTKSIIRFRSIAMKLQMLCHDNKKKSSKFFTIL